MGSRNQNIHGSGGQGGRRGNYMYPDLGRQLQDQQTQQPSQVSALAPHRVRFTADLRALKSQVSIGVKNPCEPIYV